MVVLEAVQIFFRMHYGLFDGTAGPQFIFRHPILACRPLSALSLSLFGKPYGEARPTGGLLTVCIILFVAGIQLFCIGILGQYLAKTYLETKKRPIYIAKETEKAIRPDNADAAPNSGGKENL